jgi:hypothetical protein
MTRARWVISLSLALFSAMGSSAQAAIQQDQMVSGGGKAVVGSGDGTQLIWAAVGEPLGGRMSGGGFILEGGRPSVPEGNTAPTITGFAPPENGRFYQGSVVAASVSASDAENDPLQCRFLADGVVLQDWSVATQVDWDTAAVHSGWHTVRVEVRDSTHTASRESRVFIFWRPPSP